MENVDGIPICKSKQKIIGRQNKRKHVIESKEYISCLPYEIMLHIFSMLPLEALVLASLVSKHWESLVKKFLSMIPSSLNFDELEMASRIICTPNDILQNQHIHFAHIYQLCLRNSIIAGNKYFTQFVNRTLWLHTGYITKKLCFNLCYDGLCNTQEKVDKWFHFALTNKVKELELDFSKGLSIGYENLYKAYELPHKHYASKSLECVKLNFSKLGISNLGAFGSLHSLFLKFVKVLGFSIEDLTTKCPLLEDLVIEYCSIPFNFMICKKEIMISRLTVINCSTPCSPKFPIEILAPKLLTFTLDAFYLTMRTSIKAPNVTDVVIAIKAVDIDGAQREALVKMLGYSSHCYRLVLNTCCIQVLSYGAHFLQLSPILFNNLKHLRLQVGLGKEELPGIAYIMRNCPYMESLTLDIFKSTTIHWVDLIGQNPIIFNIEEDHYWQTQASSFRCLHYLKEIIIYGIFGTSSEIRMLQFFLENAKALEDMSLYIPEDLGQFILEQLSIDRKASSRAIISIRDMTIPT